MTLAHRQRQRDDDQNNEHQAAVAPLKSNQILGGDEKIERDSAQHTAVVIKRSPRQRSYWLLGVAATAVAVIVFWCIADRARETDWATAHSVEDIVLKNRRAEDETSTFIAWFQSNGGRVSEKISIARFEGMGRGIVARGPVSDHDELLFVPLDVIICQETIWKLAPRKFLAKYKKLRDAPTELLTAFLLFEQFKDSSSYWYPYLRMLPAYPPDLGSAATPLLYDSDETINELQDERMIQAATLERRQAKTAFRRFSRLFKTVLPAADSNVALLLEKKYLWTRFLINSRAFSIRGERFLVPFGDVFNGKPQPNDDRALADGSGAHFLKYHRLQKGRGMEILADRAVAKGEQVFEDYGDNDNYIYFLYHGFLMEANPFDCAAARLPTVPASAIVKQILETHSIGDGDNRLVCITPQGTVNSPQDKHAIQLQASATAMDDEYAAALCSLRENYALCTSHATRAEQEDLLAVAVRHQLKRIKTTVEEDVELLENESMAPALRHAIEFRLSRKQILTSALAKLQENIEQRGANHMKAAQNKVSAPQEQESVDERMQRFTEWIDGLKFPINHIELKYVSPSMGYGAFATEPLHKGDIYLSVPVDVVMDIRSALRSPFIRDFILQSRRSSVRVSESRLLLLHLLHEKFAPGHISEWRPYLDILPDHERLASPLFFASDGPELQLLDYAVPHDLSQLVREYRNRVDADFASMHQRTQPPLPDWISIERFRWANAILDSRSIWWAGTRHLVPLLDMVNCMELSQDHIPHATHLAVTEDAAITRASLTFDKGDHVVENYAQANYIYLLYHGFVLSENSYDCAHFHFELDRAKHLPSQNQHRQAVVAIMEEMKLFSWSQDICVGGQKSSRDSSHLDRLLRLSLIAQSPEKAAQAERRSMGKITLDHTDAAIRETTERVDRLAAAIAKHSTHREEQGIKPIRAYIEQQHRHMLQVLKQLQKQQG